MTKDRTAIQQWLVEAPDEASALEIARESVETTGETFVVEDLEDDWEDTWTVSSA